MPDIPSAPGSLSHEDLVEQFLVLKTQNLSRMTVIENRIGIIESRMTTVDDRITVMEISLGKIQSDTTEILDWIHNAKLGGKIAAKTFHGLGRLGLYIIQTVGALAVIYAAINAIRNGKFPTYIP